MGRVVAEGHSTKGRRNRVVVKVQREWESATPKEAGRKDWAVTDCDALGNRADLTPAIVVPVVAPRRGP